MNTTPNLAFFEDNGFLVIPDFFSTDQINEIRNEIQLLIDNYEFKIGDNNTFATQIAVQNDDKYFLESARKVSFFLEDDALDKNTGELCVSKQEAFNKVAHALHDLNPVFEKFSYQPALLNIVKTLGFDIPQICQSMFIFKSPKVGGQIYPHQDSTFLQTSPASCIGTWVSLDDATLENGCMWFVPGSHKKPLERFFNLNEEGTSCSFNIDGYKYDTTQAIPVPVRAGTLVLIHGSVIHYSGPNHSDKRRNAYSLHIIDGKCEYLDTNWLKKDPEKPFRNFEEVTRTLYPHINEQNK